MSIALFYEIIRLLQVHRERSLDSVSGLEKVKIVRNGKLRRDEIEKHVNIV